MSKATKTQAVEAPVQLTPRYCACGCNQQILSKASYKPGHDAAHVSALVAELANQYADKGGFSQNDVTRLAKALPSDALRGKFERAADRLATRKAPKVAAKAVTEPVVTVHPMLGHVYKSGRWTYPTAEISISDSDEIYVARNTKRDGTGEWIRIENGDQNLIDA